MTALALEKLSVRYGAVDAVRGLSLEVKPGQIVGLIGPNGAGKSSTLHAIMGSAPVAGGDVLFDGRSLVGRRPEDVARRGIALVPEGRRIFGELTVEENLRLAGRGNGEDDAAMERILERFPILRERAGEHADRLSGGEQQQLAIARALLGRPKLLILDEPSLGLAPKTIDLIYELLEGLREEGTTMLLVEQNAARTIDFCDRCLVLGGGRARAQGGREALRADSDLVRAYLGGQP